MVQGEILSAVRGALADYLRTTLAAQFSTGLAVYEDWPSGNDLAKYTIAVLTAGDPEVEYYPPFPLQVTPDQAPAATGTVLYGYGRIDGLPLELDCWAPTEQDRDTLAVAIAAAVNRAPSATLGGPTDFAPYVGLVIPVTGLYGQTWYYEFNPTPAVAESSQAAERTEWRAHWRGYAEGRLVRKVTGVPLVKTAGLYIGAGEKELGTNPRDNRSAVGTARCSPNSLALTRPGAGQLSLFASYGNLQVDVTRDAAWSSSNPQIARIDPLIPGRVFAGSQAGTATITGTYGSASATAAVTVS